MTDKTPLSTPAALVMGAVALSPVIGAGFSLAQGRWAPLGFGLVLAGGLFIVSCVGEAIAAARRARTQPLKAQRCWSCGMEQGDPDGPGLVRLGSESGKREPDSNPITRPGPPESGRRGA